MSKNDNRVDDSVKTFRDNIIALEEIDTTVDIILDENGTRDCAINELLQGFNDAKFNGQNHTQWRINWVTFCNEQGIQVKQKDADKFERKDVNLIELAPKTRSIISKIKRYQQTTVSNNQVENGVVAIGEKITKATKWYDIKKATAPVVDEEQIKLNKQFKSKSIEDKKLALEFIALQNDMKALEVFVNDVKSAFEERQKAQELEKQSNAK
jgi:hypothetical protein